MTDKMFHQFSQPYDLSRLQDNFPAWQLRHVPVITSTNDWAKAELETGSTRAPALLVADSQSAGRGRGTNSWWSAPGNVAATFVVSQIPHVPPGLLPLLAGLAVRRALVSVTDCAQIHLKWPNDVVVGQRKVAGLLCERLRRAVLIGVGVNVNADSSVAPEQVRERITSLRMLTGNDWDLTGIVCEIGRELQQVVTLKSEAAARDMLQEYSLHHWPTDKHVELINAERAARVSGRCLGIDPDGRLIVKTRQGTRTFLTGSVVSVTPAREPGPSNPG